MERELQRFLYIKIIVVNYLDLLVKKDLLLRENAKLVIHLALKIYLKLIS